MNVARSTKRLFSTGRKIRQFSSLDLSGIYPPIPTPFTDQEDIAWDQLQSNINKWSDIGFKGNWLISCFKFLFQFQFSSSRVCLRYFLTFIWQKISQLALQYEINKVNQLTTNTVWQYKLQKGRVITSFRFLVTLNREMPDD